MNLHEQAHAMSRANATTARRGMATGKRWAERAAHIINIMNIAWLDGALFGATVRPKASASPSKHCVPVHTVWRSSESSTSCVPGLCGAF